MDRVNCCCCCCCCCCTHFSTFPKMTLLWLDTLLSSTQLSASERGGRGAEFSQQQRLRRRERQTFAGYVLGWGPLLLVLPLTTTCGTGGKRGQVRTAPALTLLETSSSKHSASLENFGTATYVRHSGETPHGICPQRGDGATCTLSTFTERHRMGFARNEGDGATCTLSTSTGAWSWSSAKFERLRQLGVCVVALCLSLVVTDSLFVRDCYILLFVFSWYRLLFACNCKGLLFVIVTHSGLSVIVTDMCL